MNVPGTYTVSVNPAARVEVTDDAVLVRNGDHVARLTGGRLPAFTQALLTVLSEGTTSLDVGEGGEARRLALEGTLDQLVEAGLLQREDAARDLAEITPAAVGMWLRVLRNVGLRTVQQRMEQARAVVLGETGLAGRVTHALAESGVNVTTAAGCDDVPGSDDEIRDVVVAVGETDRDPLLEEWNSRAVTGERTWLPVVPFDGRRALVGPWTLPRESACLTCYQLRRDAAFPDRNVVADLVRARPVATPGDRAALWPGLTTMQVGLVVERVVEWFGLTDTNAGLAAPGGLHTLEMTSDGIHLRNHRVYRVPRCPTCSPARDRGYPMIWFHPLSGIPLHSHDDNAGGAR